MSSWEARLRARDGSIKHVLMSANVLWEDGRLVHIRCFSRDITDRRRMEEARREADLLHHVASLAHAAAHEINNPLAVINGSIDLIARTAATETKPRIEACREAGGRIVIVLGHPPFYRRFGFSSELASKLESPFAGEAFMAVELAAGALVGVRGRVQYPPPFEQVS